MSWGHFQASLTAFVLPIWLLNANQRNIYIFQKKIHDVSKWTPEQTCEQTSLWWLKGHVRRNKIKKLKFVWDSTERFTDLSRRLALWYNRSKSGSARNEGQQSSKIRYCSCPVGHQRSVTAIVNKVVQSECWRQPLTISLEPQTTTGANWIR